MRWFTIRDSVLRIHIWHLTTRLSRRLKKPASNVVQFLDRESESLEDILSQVYGMKRRSLRHARERRRWAWDNAPDSFAVPQVRSDGRQARVNGEWRLAKMSAWYGS